MNSHSYANLNALHLLNQNKLLKLYENGDFEKLDETCDSIIKHAKNEVDKGSALLFKSLSEQSEGRYIEAERFVLEAESKFTKYRKKALIALAKVKRSMILFSKGDLDAASALILSTEPLVQDLNLPSLKLELSELQSLLLAAENKHYESIDKLKEAYSIIETSQKADPNKKRSIQDQIASNYYSIGEIDSAIFHYENLIANTAFADLTFELNTLSTLSDLHINKGSYKKAQGLLINAIRKAENGNEEIFLLNLNTQITGLFIYQKQWESALTFCNSALEILKEQSNSYLEAIVNRYKGIIQHERDEDAEAQRSFERSILLFIDMSNYGDVAYTISEMSDLGMTPPKVPGLVKEIQKLIKIHTRTGDETGVIKNKFVLAQLYLAENNPTKAIMELEKVLLLAEHNNNLPAKEKAHFLLSKSNKSANNYPKALEHSLAYHEIFDVLRSDNVNETINRLNIEYATEKTAQELENERLINAKQGEELRRKKLQNILLLIGTLMAAILAGSFYLIKEKNKLLQKQKLTMLKKEKETALLKAVLKGEELERSRVARELHDGLGTTLATVKMQINGIQNTYPDVTDLEAYQKAEMLIDSACDNVRHISHDMMPSVIHEQGLENATASLCNLINVKEDLHIDFIPFQLDKIKSKEVEFNSYRIVQELLKNILKHAEAQEVIVQLTNEDHFLSIVVEDDGKGFDTQSVENGIGLDNIRFRVKNLEGEIEIDSNPESGSTFNIKLPLEKVEV